MELWSQSQGKCAYIYEKDENGIPWRTPAIMGGIQTFSTINLGLSAFTLLPVGERERLRIPDHDWEPYRIPLGRRR